MRTSSPVRIAGLVLFGLLALPLRADVGLWLFSAPPRAQVKSAYQFELTDTWLDHVMKSSVRFGTASASFVSADGLIITNHHVARTTIQKLSTEKNDYMRDGFYARTTAAELKCPDLAVSVLQSTVDVTARVNAAVAASMSADAAALARRKAMTEIEKESQDQTGLQSLVVTLYQGGQYHLYRYKRYTDVRLVFAPEFQVAHFGGDVDNFEYPRYCLDVSFFRAYENGVPAHPSDFLKWSAAGAQDGELVFISGHPGTTDRLLTVAELERLRDVNYPLISEDLYQNEVLLLSWGARNDENARRAQRVLLGLQNNRKRYEGFVAGLQDPALLAGKRREEAEFKHLLATRHETAALAAYDAIASATVNSARVYPRWLFLESGSAFQSQSFTFARDLLRAGDERAKPNGERLRAYTDARLPAFEQALFSPAPVYEDLETLRLANSLSRFATMFGAQDATVRAVLAGKSPRARAAELIRTTQVRDVAFRRKLYEGGAAVVAEAHDPLIEVARIVDGEARALNQVVETENEKIHAAHAAIAQQRFALYGASEYPDATGTLRLTFGRVQGYTEEGGAAVPALTVSGGLFARNALHHDREPFTLPERWHEAERRSALPANVPYNFVSTCDTHGGNSGSPTINRAGEFVGILFDGNIESLSGGMVYDDVRSRSVSVHSAIILAALEKIFDAGPLAAELRRGGLPRVAAAP